MRPFLTDWPRPVARETYGAEISRMAARLSALEGVVSVYQLGSVDHPGISDVDLVCVFEDDARCHDDPLRAADGVRRYIFTHSPFGASRTHFAAGQKYSGFYGFHHLRGEELPVRSGFKDEEWERPLKVQVALEFLLRMYIVLTVEIIYGIHRVRSLLLQARALHFDLKLLGISRGPLAESVEQVSRWRNSWFEERPGRDEIVGWAGTLSGAVEACIEELLRTASFAAPGKRPLSLAPNMTLVPGGGLGYEHRGFVLPTLLGRMGKKAVNLQNRWNRFEFRVPMIEPGGGVLGAKAEYDREILRHNAQRLPHFMPLAGPLHDRSVP